ncbi:MAG: DNA cytosine methyltransferase, partial [Clostridia bacterium]|nr:DNA cytosine methyltransferase [Clostridia bacterium]
PKYFLCENVIGLSATDKEIINNCLGVKPIKINSALLSGQNRPRNYWTNIKGVELPIDKHILFKNVVEQNNRIWRPLGNWCFNYYGKKQRIDFLYKIDAEKCHTLTTKKCHPNNYYLSTDGTKLTNLTINEFEILQTLPVDYTAGISEPKRYEAVGNGWTVDVIAHILKFIERN